MPCELCRVYLHDYFEQSIEKDNPLSSCINKKKLREHSSEVSKLILRFHSIMNPFILYNAKSDVENYINFIAKPKNSYELHQLCYQFLKRNIYVASELRGLQSDILAFNFLKIKRTDPYATVVEKWLAFLIGSLFEDMYELHRGHTKKDLCPNLDKGLPGHPWTAAKIVRMVPDNDNKAVGERDPEDDLYS